MIPIHIHLANWYEACDKDVEIIINVQSIPRRNEQVFLKTEDEQSLMNQIDALKDCEHYQDVYVEDANYVSFVRHDFRDNTIHIELSSDFPEI